ncbi:hypothetical protein DAPPUDRAFT_321402 [Daphnia pulex]|uniref:Uncharacterized protein n=1 Tax=Daphnia pulex TaxID=6669 RepID=E9GST0_DAPPU|nr:hypothetical protein DAPPUDRAFT_321402 [Daphnia pulex]|eukprot:EFX77483.1 hypothetical protein DAPPUDRAFT_321402 [Daphnia pulex]
MIDEDLGSGIDLLLFTGGGHGNDLIGSENILDGIEEGYFVHITGQFVSHLVSSDPDMAWDPSEVCLSAGCFFPDVKKIGV